MRVSSDFVGSPPHTRGKGTRDAVWFYVRGITPAYTGKRHLPVPFQSYPTGSPPHTRGKDNSLCFYVPLAGITPAYTGKRCLFLICQSFPWDHPRIHGEKKTGTNGKCRKPGSPPHTRGKVNCSLSISDTGRITPAYTGKSDTF